MSIWAPIRNCELPRTLSPPSASLLYHHLHHVAQLPTSCTPPPACHTLPLPGTVSPTSPNSLEPIICSTPPRHTHVLVSSRRSPTFSSPFPRSYHAVFSVSKVREPESLITSFMHTYSLASSNGTPCTFSPQLTVASITPSMHMHTIALSSCSFSVASPLPTSHHAVLPVSPSTYESGFSFTSSTCTCTYSFTLPNYSPLMFAPQSISHHTVSLVSSADALPPPSQIIAHSPVTTQTHTKFCNSIA